MKFSKLTSGQIDALREIGNIGAGNAATAMSKLINKKIGMQVPSVNIVSYDEMMEMIGGPEELIVAICFRILGNAPGTVYFILSIKEAEYLVSQITNNEELNSFNNDPIDDLAVSVLQEVGNILTGSYLSALSDLTNINMMPSIPHLIVDMAGAVLTVGLLELSRITDYAIIIDTKIDYHDSQNGIHGNFLLMPDPESFQKIFNSIGIKGYE